jgi:hypothetical protein
MGSVRLGVAGWSSLVARQVHTLEVAGSNPAPATYGEMAELVDAPGLGSGAERREGSSPSFPTSGEWSLLVGGTRL